MSCIKKEMVYKQASNLGYVNTSSIELSSAPTKKHNPTNALSLSTCHTWKLSHICCSSSVPQVLNFELFISGLPEIPKGRYAKAASVPDFGFDTWGAGAGGLVMFLVRSITEMIDIPIKSQH